MKVFAIVLVCCAFSALAQTPAQNKPALLPPLPNFSELDDRAEPVGQPKIAASDAEITPRGPNALTYAKLKSQIAEHKKALEEEACIRDAAPKVTDETFYKIAENYQTALRKLLKDDSVTVRAIAPWALQDNAFPFQVHHLHPYPEDKGEAVLSEGDKWAAKYKEAHQDYRKISKANGENLVRVTAHLHAIADAESIKLDTDGYIVPGTGRQRAITQIRFARYYVNFYSHDKSEDGTPLKPDSDAHRRTIMYLAQLALLEERAR